MLLFGGSTVLILFVYGIEHSDSTIFLQVNKDNVNKATVSRQQGQSPALVKDYICIFVDVAC